MVWLTVSKLLGATVPVTLPVKVVEVDAVNTVPTALDEAPKAVKFVLPVNLIMYCFPLIIVVVVSGRIFVVIPVLVVESPYDTLPDNVSAKGSICHLPPKSKS